MLATARRGVDSSRGSRPRELVSSSRSAVSARVPCASRPPHRLASRARGRAPRAIPLPAASPADRDDAARSLEPTRPTSVPAARSRAPRRGSSSPRGWTLPPRRARGAITLHDRGRGLMRSASPSSAPNCGTAGTLSDVLLRTSIRVMTAAPGRKQGFFRAGERRAAAGRDEAFPGSSSPAPRSRSSRVGAVLARRIDERSAGRRGQFDARARDIAPFRSNGGDVLGVARDDDALRGVLRPRARGAPSPRS